MENINKSLENIIEGVLFLHSETGTEGGYWAFQDLKYILSKNRWSYEGLHILEDGDNLTIYNPDNKAEVVWSGVIALKQHPLFTESASGLWIHADQAGIDRDVWAEYFFKEYPAKLIPGKS